MVLVEAPPPWHVETNRGITLLVYLLTMLRTMKPTVCAIVSM